MPARLFLACGLLAALPAVSPAAFATYTQTVTASGSLGRVAFVDALVTLTQTADTNNVVFANGFFSVGPITSTVSVAGFGSGSFTVPTFTGSQPNPGFAGLGQGTVGVGGPSVLSVLNPVFAPYDLKSSLGPVSGTALFNSGSPFGTTAGDLIIQSVSGDATFTAVVTPTANVAPAPAGAVLGVLGLPALGLLRVRRRAIA